MKRVLAVLLLASASAAVACGGVKETETGPEIRATVTFDRFSVRSQDAFRSADAKEFELGADMTDYVITMSIDASDGTARSEKSGAEKELFPAQAPVVDVSVEGGAKIPAPKLEAKTSFQSTSFTSDELVVPGSEKGKTLLIHIEASDTRGLVSNAIDFKIPLR
ncbi:MAG: hypothetical protein KIT84_44620 [Labilithrix sp.]|nr:hypothetical protein [Labilithrix sp.]MCW5818165.1 hypothetical protein [Labilithrix sp.]